MQGTLVPRAPDHIVGVQGNMNSDEGSALVSPKLRDEKRP